MEITRKVNIEMEKKETEGMDDKQREEQEITDMVKLLDGFADSGDSRLKLNLSDVMWEARGPAAMLLMHRPKNSAAYQIADR